MLCVDDLLTQLLKLPGETPVAYALASKTKQPLAAPVRLEVLFDFDGSPQMLLLVLPKGRAK